MKHSSGPSESRSKPGKYRELEVYLREAIASGTLAPGQRLPSFAELREQFGMAPSTVSRALQELERDGLLRRRAGSGIFVSELLGRPPKGVVGLRGFNLASRRDNYWMQIMGGIEEVAGEAGSHLLLMRPEGRPAWETLDGVLLIGEGAPAEVMQLPVIMPRVVLWNAPLPAPTVYIDDQAGMREATAALIAQGHRRIAYLGFANSEIIQNRIAGYTAAFAAAGLVPEAHWVRCLTQVGGNNLQVLGYHNMAAWLIHGWRQTGCTAILVQNDSIARGVMDALDEVGLAVPGDVSVVGYDGMDAGADMTPPLSSVQVPLHEWGREAMRLLLDQIYGASAENVNRVLAPRLLTRSSTGPAPAAAETGLPARRPAPGKRGDSLPWPA